MSDGHNKWTVGPTTSLTHRLTTPFGISKIVELRYTLAESLNTQETL